jgi:hypothetical protein
MWVFFFSTLVFVVPCTPWVHSCNHRFALHIAFLPSRFSGTFERCGAVQQQFGGSQAMDFCNTAVVADSAPVIEPGNWPMNRSACGGGQTPDLAGL